MARPWYKKLGYKKNPLHVEPYLGDNLFGYDLLLDELFYRIDAGNIIFLKGPLGKTAVLTKIIERYKGKGRVAYVNASEVAEEPDIKVLLSNGKKKTLDTIRGLPKNMIILLDNVSTLSKQNCMKIQYYFDQGNIQSVILTGKSYVKTLLPLSLKHRIGKRLYSLKELTKSESIDVIMDRLEFKDYITTEHIGKLYDSCQDFKELLQKTESLLVLMVTEEKKTVDDHLISTLLEKKNVMV